MYIYIYIYIFPSSLEHILNAFRILRGFRKHEAMLVIKTLINAWTTSARFHEVTRSACLLGCEVGSDDQRHYVRCDTLQRVVDECLLKQFQLFRSPLACNLFRIAIRVPSESTLKFVAATCVGYHAIKRSSFAQDLRAGVLSSSRGVASTKLFSDAFVLALRDSKFSPEECNTEQVFCVTSNSDLHEVACLLTHPVLVF